MPRSATAPASHDSMVARDDLRETDELARCKFMAEIQSQWKMRTANCCLATHLPQQWDNNPQQRVAELKVPPMFEFR
jgi:hypothetical protein